MDQSTEMSSLDSMLFRTFLNPLKFFMKIFNILVLYILCRHVYISICLKPPHTRFMHPHTSVGFCMSVLPNLLQVTPNHKWPTGGNAERSAACNESCMPDEAR